MKLQIDKQLLKFPNNIPNDLEAFIIFYPKKFPPIIKLYEDVAKQIWDKPQKFREYGDWAYSELSSGFEKINKEYKQGNQNDLEFLVKIDQKFNKLFCYRFWIVNYLFADGPLHDYFVENIKRFSHSIVDIGESVEEFEMKTAQITRDLLQGDYADLYLQQALDGLSIIRLSEKNPVLSPVIAQVTKLIKDKSTKNKKEINKHWQEFIKKIKKEKSELYDKLETPLELAKMMNTKEHVYNALTHAVEFKDKNHELSLRYKSMKNKIKEIMQLAKEKLSPLDFQLFELSYQQANNFIRYKDVMGNIDPKILPVWFKIHKQIKTILIKQGVKIPNKGTGHAAIFYFYAWYLPAELKNQVMTPDFTPFDLNTI